MRPSVLSLALLAAATPAAAESTRTLQLALSGSARSDFAVENLAGSMRIVSGADDKVSITATVHGETDALASAVQLVQTVNEKGVPTLRVRYPLDQHTAFRYPEGRSQDPESSLHWLANLFGGDSSTTKYDGRRVSVSNNRGVLLYADLVITVPKTDVRGHFQNNTGPVDARAVHGRLAFDTGSGSVTLDQVGGDVTADTGSGNVKASNIDGSFKCDTGSGACQVTAFRGEALDCDTGSGDVTIDGAVARRITADTGSGGIVVRRAEVAEITADAGSGDVELEVGGPKLTSIAADTGSGSVTLRLDPDVAFEARADMGSGEISSRYADAQAIMDGREVVGFRRGSGQVRIDVDTGSGDVTLEPRSR